MNQDIIVSDVRISLHRVEVSRIVSSDYVKIFVTFLCIVHLYFMKFYS